MIAWNTEYLLSETSVEQELWLRWHPEPTAINLPLWISQLGSAEPDKLSKAGLLFLSLNFFVSSGLQRQLRKILKEFLFMLSSFVTRFEWSQSAHKLSCFLLLLIQCLIVRVQALRKAWSSKQDLLLLNHVCFKVHPTTYSFRMWGFKKTCCPPSGDSFTCGTSGTPECFWC